LNEEDHRIMSNLIQISKRKLLVPEFQGGYNFGIEVLRKMVEAKEREWAVSIVDITDPKNQVQVFTTAQFNEILQVSPEVAVPRIMNVGWLPEHLDETMRQAEQESAFRKTYIAGLHRYACGEFTAEMEFFKDPETGRSYRYNRNVGVKEVPFPDAMRQLTAFDW
jgi:hypothetical protein